MSLGFPPEIPERFNLAGYLLDARIEEGRGARTAILFEDRRLSYADVQAEANRMANVLRDAGVTIEDRVLIALPDCPLFVATFFAILKLGAVVTMVNPDLPAGDHAYYLGYTRARALVCDEALHERLAAVVPGARHLRAVLRRGGGLEEKLAAASATFENEDTSRDDVAAWLFTSGSTGKPKGAVHFHHDFAYSTECYARRVLGMTEDDVTIAGSRLFFGYGTGSNLIFPFAVGGACVLFEDRPTPERLFELIERHRPTLLACVPTTIGKMLAHAGAAGRDLSSLRATVSAGEALPEELFHRWAATFHSEILDGIGSAELFHIYLSNRPGEARAGTVGRVVPGYEARLVDDDGRELGAGEIGTLWVKGDSAALCYFHEHERSKRVLRGDWVVSGDRLVRDAEGFFRYAGRADDLLKVGGLFVAPHEVEDALMQHPAVLECAVVGFEDEEHLVKPRAVVVVRAGHPAGPVLAEELIALAREKLAHYKVPRRVDFIGGLPRSDRGKLLRGQVAGDQQAPGPLESTTAPRSGSTRAPAPARRAAVQPAPVRLADAAWVDVRDLLARRPDVVALLPVGALEAHGPHLPLATDVIIAEGLARRAAAALEAAGRAAVIAPALAYAVTDHAGGFAGTTGIPAEVATAHVRAVVTGLGRAGFRRVCLVNAHLEPAHVASLRAALAALPGAVLADCTERRFARTLSEELKRGACHAGSYETSLLLAERPDLVRDGRRAGLAPLPIDLARAMRAGVRTFEEAGARDAYFGDPAAATREEGEGSFARLVEMVLTVVGEAWPEPAG